VLFPVIGAPTPVKETLKKQQVEEPAADPSAPDHEKVVVKGDGYKLAYVRADSEFIIDASETRGAQTGIPMCTIYGKKAEIPVEVTPLGNGVFRATYVALLPGL